MPSEIEKLNDVFKKVREARAQEIAETEAWCAAAERAVAELKAAAAAAKAKAEEMEEANANRNAARGPGFRAVRSLKRKGGRRNRKTRRSV